MSSTIFFFLFSFLFEGWLGWAQFCDNQFQTTPSHISTSEVSTTKTKQVWAQHAVSCYLQALKCDQRDSIRKHLARVFWLVTNDSNLERPVVPLSLTLGSLFLLFLSFPYSIH
jgi:hypothetical protein